MREYLRGFNVVSFCPDNTKFHGKVRRLVYYQTFTVVQILRRGPPTPDQRKVRSGPAKVQLACNQRKFIPTRVAS